MLEEPDGVVEILPGPSERGVVGYKTPNRTRNSLLARVRRKMTDSGNEDVGHDKGCCRWIVNFPGPDTHCHRNRNEQPLSDIVFLTK